MGNCSVSNNINNQAKKIKQCETFYSICIVYFNYLDKCFHIPLNDYICNIR